jgi:site-specific recombinase XerD
MIESELFEEPNTRSRFLDAPCLKEREQYLYHLMRQGYGPGYLRVTSALMLRVIEFLGLTKLRMVELQEIERASQAWAAYRGPDRRGKVGETTARFPRVAKSWLRFHDRLAVPTVPVHPYEKELVDFREFLRLTNGASPKTILGYGTRAKLFLSWLVAKGVELSRVSLNEVDEFLGGKSTEGWSLWTIACYAQALRSFFLYAEGHGWCRSGLARGIRKPSLPKYDPDPRGPKWSDVRRLLRHESKKTTAQGLRAHAILLLCSIYALRSSEVTGLRLIDIDWREETFCVKRAKRGGYQRYPLQYEVGEAILRYLKVRPSCACRNVFVTFQGPHRPVSGFGMWNIVSHRYKALGIETKRRGPHSLRHACATQLLKKGTPLKDIADFLGHRTTQAVGVYAKFDTRSLRQVAAFSLKGL